MGDIKDVTSINLGADVAYLWNVADEFNALLPDSDLFWIEKCGHAPMMEHPDTFNTLLENWLVARGF